MLTSLPCAGAWGGAITAINDIIQSIRLEIDVRRENESSG